SLTKLTYSAFADALADYCGCNRVRSGELVASRFAGAHLSARFLREGRLFPYEDAGGVLTLAVARPPDADTIHAVEIALRRPVTVAVATAEDIEAALGTTVEAERLKADTPAE